MDRSPTRTSSCFPQNVSYDGGPGFAAPAAHAPGTARRSTLPASRNPRKDITCTHLSTEKFVVKTADEKRLQHRLFHNTTYANRSTERSCHKSRTSISSAAITGRVSHPLDVFLAPALSTPSVLALFGPSHPFLRPPLRLLRTRTDHHRWYRFPLPSPRVENTHNAKIGTPGDDQWNSTWCNKLFLYFYL